MNFYVLEKDFVFGFYLLGIKEKVFVKVVIEDFSSDEFDDFYGSRYIVFMVIGRGFGISICRWKVVSFNKVSFFFLKN